MRKKLFFGALVGVGLVAGAAVLHAANQPGDGQTPPSPCGGLFARFHQLHGGQMQRLHGELNLTPEQREALHQTLLAHRVEIADALRPIVDAHRALHDAVMAEKSDAVAIRKAGDTLGKAVGDAAVTFASIKGELLANAKLTPDQLKKASAMRDAFQASVDGLLNTLKSAPEKPSR
jgi:Spy/CpxP family protein refolding chaperone